MKKTTLSFHLVGSGEYGSSGEKWEMFKHFNAIMNEQNERRVAAARNAVENSKVPLSDEVREILLELNHEDVLDILRLHPGCKASEIIKSMRFAVALFNKSISGYLLCSEQFCRLSNKAGFFDKVNEVNVDELNLSVGKEIYSVSFYSKMLVDQSHRLRALINVDGYEKMLKSTICATNAHSFIVELRNMVGHELVIPHNYSMSWGRDNVKTSLEFSTKTLLQNDWNAYALEYINSASGKINIDELYNEYRKAVNSFYSWWLQEIENNKPVEVQDYESLERAIDSRNFNQTYKVIVKFAIDNKKNPYSYLEKYISGDVLREILALPSNSKLQVDAIIAYADRDSHCDEDLRLLLYKLFSVPE